jgi:Tfp pilus assembly protein PilF
VRDTVSKAHPDNTEGNRTKLTSSCGMSSLALVWWPMHALGRSVLAVCAVALSHSDAEMMARAARAGLPLPGQHPSSSVSVKCPTSEEINRILGEGSALLEQANYQEAAQVLETLTAARCDPRAYLLFAAASEATGQIVKSEETLETAHSIWPTNTSIATSLAREYLNDKKFDKAAKTLNGFHVVPSTPPQEVRVAVLVYLAAHLLPPAQTLAETNYRRHPSLDSLLLLANVLQLEGRYKAVNQLLDGQRKAFADSALFLITFAESEFDAMLFDAARTDLEHAITFDPSSYQAHYLLGNVLVAQNKLDQAESEYRKAILLSPGQPRTYYQLALLFRSRPDDADEELLLKQALAADAHYAPAHCEMGRIELDRRQLADAITELNLAIQDNPLLEQAYYLLARAYATSGQKDKADETVGRYKALRAANRRGAVDAHPGEIRDATAAHEK